MFDRSIVEKSAASGLKKSRLLEQNPARYLMRSVLAGMYLSIVVLVFWSIVNNMSDPTVGKLLGSAFFGVGLSIIIFTNSELFTSNNMYMAVSSAEGRTSWAQAAKLWAVCWLGNLIGAVFLALLLSAAGVLNDLPAEHALYSGALHKAHQTAMVIFFKGILANWVVCLAVWVSLQLKEDIAKFVALILIVFIFLYLGFEHSIANMGTFSMSLLGRGTLTPGDAVFNLVFSTVGNIVGGACFVGLSYSFLNPDATDIETGALATANEQKQH
jgi:nitrite transporter NirC